MSSGLKPGWTRTQRGRVVTWSGGKIGVGEFAECGLSAHLPNTPGQTLTFPANQTYANGKVVQWIGAESSDEPAPHVTLEAAGGRNVHDDDRRRRERGRAPRPHPERLISTSRL